MNQAENWIPSFKDNVENGAKICIKNPKHTRNVGHHEGTKLRWGRILSQWHTSDLQ